MRKGKCYICGEEIENALFNTAHKECWDKKYKESLYNDISA